MRLAVLAPYPPPEKHQRSLARDPVTTVIRDSESHRTTQCQRTRSSLQRVSRQLAPLAIDLRTISTRKFPKMGSKSLTWVNPTVPDKTSLRYAFTSGNS